jgi:hypothetical protein
MSNPIFLLKVSLTTNVAYASITHKGKIFAVEKSDVSKIEVVSNDVVTFEHMNYLATDSICYRATSIKALNEEVNFVNVFLVPDRLILNDNRVVHNTIYILNIPKSYDLPNKNIAWHYGANIRC